MKCWMLQNTHRVDKDLGSSLGAGVVLQEGNLHLVPLVLLEAEGSQQLDVLGPRRKHRLLQCIELTSERRVLRV